MKKNFLCSYYCSRPSNRCCDCYSREICCSDLIFIEEIFTWICIGSLIVFFYKTIKLCFIIGLILWIGYWIYRRTDLPRLLKELLEKKSELKNENDEPSPVEDQIIEIPIKENIQDSLPNVDDIKPTSNNDYTKPDSNVHEMKKLERSLPVRKPSQPSRTKKLLMDDPQDQEKLSSKNSHNEQSIPSEPDPLILNDLHQTIGHLHDDILQLKTNSISALSLDEQTKFQLATEHLIQKIISSCMNRKLDSTLSLFEDTEKKSNQSEMISNKIESSTEIHLEHPKCINTQPSIAIDSLMPSVPNRSTVMAIIEDDEKSCDNIITTNEQFENIISMDRKRSENIPILKDSMVHSNDSPTWIHYLTKPDLFPTTLRSDLPIVQSDEQSLSFKQNFLSYFHRRPKLTSGNHPAAFHSSSLNANDYLKSLKQGIFRVRKSRIIISFDNIQQDNDNYRDVALEINQLQTEITNSSIISLFQSFKSTTIQTM